MNNTDAAPTRTFTVLNSLDGTFRVHKCGCRDIERGERYNGKWDVEGVSADDVIEREVEALRGDFGDEADDFIFAR
jgi:hypothetical protein